MAGPAVRRPIATPCVPVAGVRLDIPLALGGLLSPPCDARGPAPSRRGLLLFPVQDHPLGESHITFQERLEPRVRIMAVALRSSIVKSRLTLMPWTTSFAVSSVINSVPGEVLARSAELLM